MEDGLRLGLTLPGSFDSNFRLQTVPVYSSRLVIRRVESVVIRSRVCCLPVVYRAQVHWDVEMGDGSDGSGDWGLLDPVELRPSLPTH